MCIECKGEGNAVTLRARSPALKCDPCRLDFVSLSIMSVSVRGVLSDILSTLSSVNVGTSSESGLARDDFCSLVQAHGLIPNTLVPSHILLLAHFFSGSCFKSSHNGCQEVITCYAYQSNFLSVLLNRFLQPNVSLVVDDDSKALCAFLGYTGVFSSGSEIIDHFTAYVHGCLFDFDVFWLADNVSILRKTELIRLLGIHNIPREGHMSVDCMRFELVKHFLACTCAPAFVHHSSPCGFSCITTSNRFTRKDSLLQALSSHKKVSKVLLASLLAHLDVEAPLHVSIITLRELLQSFGSSTEAGGSTVFARDNNHGVDEIADGTPRAVESMFSSFQASLEPVPHDAEVLEDLDTSALWPRPLTSMEKDIITS